VPGLRVNIASLIFALTAQKPAGSMYEIRRWVSLLLADSVEKVFGCEV
jgi:hypothetical protein